MHGRDHACTFRCDAQSDRSVEIAVKATGSLVNAATDSAHKVKMQGNLSAIFKKSSLHEGGHAVVHVSHIILKCTYQAC